VPADYPHSLVVPTRWNDNDVFGHLNNTVYYVAMDTTATRWLLGAGGLDLEGGTTAAVVASSGCEYRASAAFPDALLVGMRCDRLGRSSATWGFGLFREGDGALLALGRWVHVFVDRATMRPVPVPDDLRARVEASLVRTTAPPPTGDDAGEGRSA
jgi:acyl-CoA thioester hydrolase